MLSKARTAVKTFVHRRSSKPETNEQVGLDTRAIRQSTSFNQQRTDNNEEDVTIVWLSNDTKDAQLRSTIESLRSINDYIQVFDDEEDALACVEFTLQEKVILVLEYISDHFITALKTLKQIDAIFLYTSMTTTQLPSGITAVCSTEQQLIEGIKYARQEISKHLVIFSIYNQNTREKHDLTHEAGSFLFFQLFKAAFKKLPQNSESKKSMLTKCRNYYENNANVLQEINNFERNYKPNEVFEWYTNDSFVYRLINKALRTENITSLCHFHFYIADLSKKLEKDFNKIKKQNPKSIIQFYRGFKTTKDEINNFEHNIGHLILTNGYLSTTRQRQIAHDFATKENIQSNIENVLFEYTVDLTKVKSVVFADMSQYNQLSKGNEILFDLGTAFKIDTCSYNPREDLWSVNVSATDEGVDVAAEYVDYQVAKMADGNIMLTFGQLIIELGDYDKAEKYFDAILQSSLPNDEETACIYYNIGRIYRLKGEYKRALDFLNRAYVTHSEARPTRLASAAKSINAIGIVYMEENNVLQAIESFETALKLYTKTVQHNHPDVGGTLINLGNIYCGQREYEEALSCFTRAQHIYEHSLPPNHPNIAILLTNIGNLHYQQRNADLALVAYQRALTINEKILPPGHPDIARSLNNLSKVHTIFSNRENGEFEHTQTVDYGSVAAPPYVEPTNTNLPTWETIEINNGAPSKMETIELKTY